MRYKHLLFLTLSFFACHSFVFAEDLDWHTYQDQIMEKAPKFWGWCPEEKSRQMMNTILVTNAQTCVEVGVFGGNSFYPIASAVAYKKTGVAYAVDSWSNEACLKGFEQDDQYNTEEYRDYWSKINLDFSF